ncbi:unnamed protein product [Closterium sp. NIES-54]
MFITLYFIVTRLPDSLRSVRDHILSLDPTSLTVDLLEQHHLAAETSAVADVEAASASVKRRSSKGKGGRGGGGGSGGGGGGSGSGGGGSSGGGGGSGGGGSGGTGGGSEGSGGGGGGSSGSGGSGGSGTGGGRTGARHGGSGGGQQQQRRSETQSPQHLREWLFQRWTSGGSDSCAYVIRTGDHAGQTCGKTHTQHCCFSRLDDAWRAEFGDEVERPHWAELLRSGVAIIDLDYDAILSAMYALSASAEGDCYRRVLPDLGIDAAALGASESILRGTPPAEALHTFTLDSGASRCFFCDTTTLTPLLAPVPVRLADPSRGPVVAHSSTVLPCLAVPSGSLSGRHLPSFSTNLVSTAALQDAMVTTTTPGGQRVLICTCTQTGRHLATFTRRPGSNLYTLATEPPQVAPSAQVSASGQVAASFSCRLLSHQTLLWHHRLGHPSLPRLLVSSLPKSLPPLPPLLAPPCLPCVKGRQRAAPHSSSFPSTTAPLQTLHMDVWGPARISGQGRECHFLLVVDDYTWYTMVFPLRSQGEVVDVLIPWIRTVRLQLRERFRQDLPVLRLHSDRDERRIGLVMEVTRTSMIHEAAPHFLWRFAGPAPSGVSQVDPLPGIAPVNVTVGSGAARSATSGGAASGGAETGGAESEGAWSGGAELGVEETGGAEPAGVGPGGAEREGVEHGGAESEGAGFGGAEPRGAATARGPTGASLRLSPQQLREWLVWHTRPRSGASGAGGAGAAGAGGTGGTEATGPGGARTRGTGAAGTGGVGGAGARDPTEELEEPGAARARGSTAGSWCPLPAPSPYNEQSGGLTERREPASPPVVPVCTASRVPRSHPPPVPGTHAMALRPSSVPLRVPLPAPPGSSLPEVPDPESDHTRAANPTVSRLLANTVTDPSF